MPHSFRDRMGGHHCSHVIGYDGDVYWTPGARRFLKRASRRDQRRQSRRIISESLTLYHADVHDDMMESLYLDMEMFGDNDYDFEDWQAEQDEPEEDYSDWDYYDHDYAFDY